MMSFRYLRVQKWNLIFNSFGFSISVCFISLPIVFSRYFFGWGMFLAHNATIATRQQHRAFEQIWKVLYCVAVGQYANGEGKKNVITFLFFNFPAFSQYIFHYKIFLELKRESSGIESLFCFLQRILQKILHCKRTQNRHTKNIS